MNIVKRELKANLKSLIIWSICIFAYISMVMTKFSVYYNNPEMTAILDSMPKAFLDAFSMNATNLTTITGFVSVVATYFYIALGLFAVLSLI